MPKKHEFDELFNESTELTTTEVRTVGNVFPKIHSTPYKIAIVGEAPGADEIEQGIPFVGYSGRELDRFLSRFGIIRDACFVGNICQHRPPGNRISAFNWDGPEIQSGLKQLSSDLRSFLPNIVLLLGGSALHAFRNPEICPSKRKTEEGLVFNYTDSISDWRGSFFISSPLAPLPEVKCIASFHPAACLRNYSWTPYLCLDIMRCGQEAVTKDLILPERNLAINLSYDQLLSELLRVKHERPLISVDIEGGINSLSCISIALSETYSFLVPLANMDGASYWREPDHELGVWCALSDILSDPNIPKVFQNGLYDRYVLQHSYGIVVRGTTDDTMLKHWELYCELEKSLGVQCSIYTKEPYYKSDGKTDSRDTFWRYCCRDSATTYEINQKLDKWITGTSKKHYMFNMDLLHPLLYMQEKGIKFNRQLANTRKHELETYTNFLQFQLDKIVGRGLTTTDRILLRATVRDVLCWKNDPSRVKKGCEEDYDRCMRILCGEGDLTESDRGYISRCVGTSLNVKSDALKQYLYGTLKLPPQKHPETGAITTDYIALQKLKKTHPHPSLPIIIELGECRTRQSHIDSMISASYDFNDCRVHAFYNEVGSETGRVTCSKLFKKRGYPLQTVEDENELKPTNHPLYPGLRDLLIADADRYLAKCDLKGADGWTVGANLAALGEPAMLDDLKFGLKPASILCYGRRHGVSSIFGRSRVDLANMCKEVKKSDWDYFAYKQCIWGFCYLMGVRKAAEHVFKLSEGSVIVSESDMRQARDMLFQRYHIEKWHNAVTERIRKQPYPPIINSPSGHVRKFFGRAQEVLGEWLAHEPQSVTTYATNQAVHKCWTDPENRDGLRLRIEPLHQVHDEFLCQFKREDTSWAITKIKSWFNNPITISGIRVTIPFEGAYGTNWAMDTSSKVGSI